MNKFRAMQRFTPPLQFVGGRGVKTTLVAAVAAIAIAAALLTLNEAPATCDGLDTNPHNYPSANETRTVGLLLNEPESICGYVLITGRFNNYVHLIDHLGRIVHSWQFDNLVHHAKLLDNGNLLVMTRQDGRNDIAEVDSNGNVVWKYARPEPDQLHHDFLKMPSGNVLMLARGIKTREEAIAAGANPAIVPDAGMEYDYLIEMRPAGSEGGDIVWEWSALDYIVQNFDPTKPNYGAPSEHPELIDINFLETPHTRPFSDAWDWLHINGIDYNPALDQIVLSPRQYSELWIIDRSVATEEAVARNSANPGSENTPPYRCAK